MSHSALCDEIAAYLKSVPGCWYFRPVNTGYGRLGIPDFICCYRGRMYGFEAKVDRDKASPWQQREMRGIVASGGIALEVRSVDQVRYVIEAPANWLP